MQIDALSAKQVSKEAPRLKVPIVLYTRPQPRTTTTLLRETPTCFAQTSIMQSKPRLAKQMPPRGGLELHGGVVPGKRAKVGRAADKKDKTTKKEKKDADFSGSCAR